MRGPAQVSSWSPSKMSALDEDTLARITDLYASDPLLAVRLADALAADALMAEREPDMAQPQTAAAGTPAGAALTQAAPRALRADRAGRRRVPAPGAGPARGGVRHHRLGYARQRGRRGGTAGRAPEGARPGPGEPQAAAGKRVDGYRGAAGDRVRPHRRDQRRTRHRSRHRCRRVSARRCGGGRARDRGLAGALGTRALPGTRPARRRSTCARCSRASSPSTSAWRRARSRTACFPRAPPPGRCAASPAPRAATDRRRRSAASVAWRRRRRGGRLRVPSPRPSVSGPAGTAGPSARSRRGRASRGTGRARSFIRTSLAGRAAPASHAPRGKRSRSRAPGAKR